MIVPISLFVFIGAHAIGQGAVIWVYISEIFPNHVRSYGQSIGTSTHWILAFIIPSSVPLLIAKIGAGSMFLFFAIMMVFQFIWVLFVMPETKGVSLEDLEKQLVPNPDIVCFGEILWDIFPNKKVIGGAPLNVALRLHSQGHLVGIISRLGDDDNGKNALEYLKRENFPIEGIQIDDSLQTGEVLVSLNDQGSATYSITQPVAWDAIEYNSVTEELVKNAKVFLFGSLACRNNKEKRVLFYF